MNVDSKTYRYVTLFQVILLQFNTCWFLFTYHNFKHFLECFPLRNTSNSVLSTCLFLLSDHCYFTFVWLTTHASSISPSEKMHSRIIMPVITPSFLFESSGLTEVGCRHAQRHQNKDFGLYSNISMPWFYPDKKSDMYIDCDETWSFSVYVGLTGFNPS